jgi:hypothetical protein
MAGQRLAGVGRDLRCRQRRRKGEIWRDERGGISVSPRWTKLNPKTCQVCCWAQSFVSSHWTKFQNRLAKYSAGNINLDRLHALILVHLYSYVNLVQKHVIYIAMYWILNKTGTKKHMQVYLSWISLGLICISYIVSPHSISLQTVKAKSCTPSIHKITSYICLNSNISIH